LGISFIYLRPLFQGRNTKTWCTSKSVLSYTYLLWQWKSYSFLNACWNSICT